MASDAIDRPDEAVIVANQYLRLERPLSALVAILVVSIFVGVSVLSSLVPAVIVGLGLIVAARLPVLQPTGRVRLRTSDDAPTVREEFSGPIPPVLAFQWGLADEVRTDGTVATYTVSYLFGLRTVEMAVETQSDTAPNGESTVESVVMEADQPWGTYSSTIKPADDQTLVEVEYTSNRRFGLRRLPQQLVARRYRDKALAAQGYTVVERERHLGL